MELLDGLSTGEIISKLKQYFTDEELDDVSGKLEQFIKESETLEDLIDEIDDFLILGDSSDSF